VAADDRPHAERDGNPFEPGVPSSGNPPSAEAPQWALADYLTHFREHRFRDGVHCPHCGGTKIHRHGTFSGRQRYRCVGCRRTFSDFTATPISYSKKATLWPVYALCMSRSFTIRRSAAVVGLCVSTSFRWRHAILAQVVNVDDAVLAGWIEFVDKWLPYSEKGSRQLRRPQRRRGRIRRDAEGTSVRVIVASDRSGTGYSAAIIARRISAAALVDCFADRIGAAATILAEDGPYGPYGVFARRIKAEFRDCRPRSRPSTGAESTVSAVRAYASRFMTWLARFYGVATKYLTRYLGWHRLLERRRPIAPILLALGWPVSPVQTE
jgi:transposase-like protein